MTLYTCDLCETRTRSYPCKHSPDYKPCRHPRAQREYIHTKDIMPADMEYCATCGAIRYISAAGRWRKPTEV